MADEIDFNAFNKKLIEEFRANDGAVGGDFAGWPLVLITTIGAKSGQERIAPLVYTKDGDDIVIIASKGGAPTSPDWYHNIVKNPSVKVELPGDTFTATATVHAEGATRDRLYRAQADAMPNFDDYQKATDRVIPVVTLTRTA
jgi:deazaflavin-dependent oxidoreductase (nitroreductase family)